MSIVSNTGTSCTSHTSRITGITSATTPTRPGENATAPPPTVRLTQLHDRPGCIVGRF